MKENLGQIIAERRLYVKGAPEKQIYVFVGAPKSMGGQLNYRCPYFITSHLEDQNLEGAGVDSYQALMSALFCIQTDINFLNKKIYAGNLRWADEDDDNLGFKFSGT